jgi:hypothetical protein
MIEMAEPQRIGSYREFWPFYLRQHARAETRLWHIAGTATASVLLLMAAATFNYRLFLAALIAGYGPAWLAHAVVEKNRPATFRYPLWALFSDYRMTAAWATGTLGAELHKAEVTESERPSG